MTLLKAWERSLVYFKPAHAMRFMQLTWNFYLYVAELVIKNFWGLIIAEIGICVYLRSLLAQGIAHRPDIDPITSLMLIVMALLWFTIHAIFFVGMYTRSVDFKSPVFYNTMIRYIQLSLCFSLCIFVIMFFFQVVGIFVVPALPFSVIMLLRYLGYVIMFFWFELPWSLYGVIQSVERGVNVFFYNLPFFVVVFCCSFLIKVLGSFVLSLFIYDSSWSMFFTKYGKFVFESFLLIVIFVFFGKVKRIHYTDHYFS